MKRILLTLIMSGWSIVLMAQAPALHQLFWSNGSITLESKKVLQGFTSYYPNLDVVFFKREGSSQIKTYHQSRVAALRFFDSGMHRERQFVKFNKPYKEKQDLFEVIPVTDLIVLRIPNATNYKYDDRSRQFIDQQDRHSYYRYWIAMDHDTQGLSMMPKPQANKIIAYIRSGELDCYDRQDQQLIQAFYQEKVEDKLLDKKVHNFISLSTD